MGRVFNFSAGPSMLPEAVLKKAQEQMLDWEGSGQCVMEMSHRSKEYESIIQKAEALLRELMDIPENYKVLFLQGGASSQFAMIPLNLFNRSKKADIVITGLWSKKAAAQISQYGSINKVASSEDATFSYIPELDPSKFDKEADFFHITYNNTIYGTRYSALPDTGSVPLVADLSSSILTHKVDVSKFGIIYAGAQKNMGPAGLTVVIIRDDLIGNAMDITPIMFNYETHAKENSLYNTPPTYSIYMCMLVLEWLKELGGIGEMEIISKRKADTLYEYLDSSAMFRPTVAKKDRSTTNIPFVTGNDQLDAKFVKEAKEAGFINIKGHRTVGGMRASIYNGMPEEGVVKLVEFMKNFEQNNA